VFEALVQCGAFDSTLARSGVSRARAFASIDVALERSRAASRDRAAGQTSLFGLFDAPSDSERSRAPSAGDYGVADAWDQREMLVRERQSLGFYVSGHPLERYLRGADGLAKIGASPISECSKMDDWAQVRLVGMAEGYRERVFKDGGGKAAFLELEDLTGRVGVRVRGRELEQFGALLTSGEPVLVAGKVSFPQRSDEADDEPEGGREPTILLNEARLLSEVVRAETRSVCLRVNADRTCPEDLQKLSRVLEVAKGKCPVALCVVLSDGAEAVLSLGEPWCVDAHDGFLSGIERIFGEQIAELR
jgi:DNA polymerase-3 subunit alpha